MRATALVLEMKVLAASCRTAAPDDLSPDEQDLVLEGCNVVAMEIAGLAERIRAVNNTPRPVPTVPQPPPPPPPPPKDRL